MRSLSFVSALVVAALGTAAAGAAAQPQPAPPPAPAPPAPARATPPAPSPAPAAPVTPAAPGPTATAMIPAEVELEVTDAAPGAAPTTSFAGALALAIGDCGTLSAGSAAAHYDVRVCLDLRAGYPASLDVELDRTVSGHAELHQKVHSETRLAMGKRIVIGRFTTGAGTTEVTALVQ